MALMSCFPFVRGCRGSGRCESDGLSGMLMLAVLTFLMAAHPCVLAAGTSSEKSSEKQSDVGVEYDDAGEGGKVRGEARELRAAGKYPQAAKLLKQKLAELRSTGPGRSQLMLDLLDDLVATYAKQGKDLEAVAAAEEAVEIALHKDFGGEEGARYGLALDRLAEACVNAGRHSEAVSHLQKVLEQLRAQMGPSHPAYQTTLKKLGDTALGAKKTKVAKKAFGEWIALLEAEPSTVASDLALAHLSMARALGTGDKSSLSRALEHAQKARQLHESQLHTPQADPLNYAFSVNAEAGVLELLDRDDEAIEAMGKARDIVAQAFGEGEGIVQQAHKNLRGLQQKVDRKTRRRDEL